LWQIWTWAENFAFFKFKAIQGRKIEMETPKRDLSIYLFTSSCVFLLFWMLYQSIESNFLTCFCTTKPQDSSSCSLSDSNPIDFKQPVRLTQHTTDGIIPKLGNYLCNQCHSFWVPKNHFKKKKTYLQFYVCRAQQKAVERERKRDPDRERA